MSIGNALKRFVTTAARRLGYEIIPAWRLPALPMASHLAALFELYGVGTVLDVGANNGQFHDFLRLNVAYTGTIHSFEPIPELAQRMTQRALREDPRWRVHPHALGANTEELELNIAASDVFSSFLSPALDTKPEYEHYMRAVRRERVMSRRLDEVFATFGAEAPGEIYLKIDTQGFDLEVLRGAPELLRKVKGLQLELSIEPIYQGTPPYWHVLEHLHSLGFTPAGMFPVTVDDFLKVVEFDCVMVRRPTV